MSRSSPAESPAAIEMIIINHHMIIFYIGRDSARKNASWKIESLAGMEANRFTEGMSEPSTTADSLETCGFTRLATNVDPVEKANPMPSRPQEVPYQLPTRGWVVRVTAAILVALASAQNSSRSPALGSGVVRPPVDDMFFYAQVVERVRHGENYYSVVDEELNFRRYRPVSVFNWRTPLYAWLLGLLPTESWGRAIFALASVTTLLITSRMMVREISALAACLTGFLLAGATAWWIEPGPILYTELWTGLAILLSIVLLAEGLTSAGVSIGLFAVFLRELALPYGLLALILAWRHGKRREFTIWCVGLALYALFFFAHGLEVSARMATHGQPLGYHWTGWMEFGGVSFLIATTRTNSLLAPLPFWCVALYLALSLAGFTLLNAVRFRLLKYTVGFYQGFFLVFGHTYHGYWGWMIAPSLALGLPILTDAILRTCRSRKPAHSA